MFHTEVGLLFQVLQYRQDRAVLKKLMETCRGTQIRLTDKDYLYACI